MEHFSEEHSNHLLRKEWLVKIDSQNSTPYLMKFDLSAVDSTCCILLTDTKSTWAEVLTRKQFARRWRDCNRLDDASFFTEAEEEDSWRTNNLELLAKAHTLGGFTDLTFEVVESNYADFAFELECDAFKWRWEAYFLGHKTSAEIVSKHLIMPLISVNYLAFSSADPVSELSESDLEKAVDKVGRTARRTVDTHIKHAISKPRAATTLRRMTAMFNFAPDLPAVSSTAEKPELRAQVKLPKARSPSHNSIMPRSMSPHTVPKRGRPDTKSMVHTSSPGSNNLQKLPLHPDSATESEADDSVSAADKGKFRAVSASQSERRDVGAVSSRKTSPLPVVTSRGTSQSKAPASDSESSPLRPAKKLKPQMSSNDDDSEEERKRRVAQLKSGSGAAGAKRGTRQPIKRGGKRF